MNYLKIIKNFPGREKKAKRSENSKQLSSNTVLAFYHPNKGFQLVTDASNHAVGRVLLQKMKLIL